ncbi:putative cell surface hydrolase (putative) [Lactobacillus selangorensis]|uniref:Putative cell surface hydrolase (Putative) n=1 Tax=Lactobacillus selangorensis TaxID=81857 RepID=A0A0R2FX64_9LACO|nr:putative cell surface hydrolase (putative) [Lactobacillus selangorensis]KRN32937.1 putative cell surface hydrolase (putative) [Lactobacillus selangorensis]
MVCLIVPTEQVHADSVTVRRQRPTLFVHGLNGGPGSFDNMIAKAQWEDHAHRALVAVITPDRIQLIGKWPKSLKRPMVQVIFKDNHANWNREGDWLDELLRELNQRYGVTSYNAIGHSRGCEAIIMAAEHPHQVARLKRLVTIAGPFDGAIWRDHGVDATETDRNGRPNVIKPEYQQVIDNAQNFPKGVHVLSIAGNLDNGSHSDGVITETSALSLHYALHSRIKSDQTFIAHGANAQHSRLPRYNEVVQKKALDFVWQIH